VIKLDQATGLWGGIVVCRSPNLPDPISFLKFGMKPSATKRFTSPGSIPSIPRTSTLVEIFGFLRYGPLRDSAGRIAEVGRAEIAARPAEIFKLWETNSRREMVRADFCLRSWDEAPEALD
jgi:hypothetical protein